jgi:hypothetical protein
VAVLSESGRRRALKAAIRKALPVAVVLAVAVAVAWPSLGRQQIDGLDEAQNVMGGWFFVDALHDMPWRHPVQWGFDYYAQYPALGFVFWPPFFHFVEGLFFLVFGFDLAVAQLCLLAFAMVLGAGAYLAAAPRMGRTLALLAALLVLTMPLLAGLQNTMLLEIPTLAMALATVVLYQRVVARGAWRGWREVVLIAVVSAMAIYTKQTILFVFPAMLFDLAVNHRGLLKNRRTWCCAALFVLLCLPLAVFTVKYGGANLAQSFGNLGNVFIEEHKVSPRWSIAGWTYYAQQLFTAVNPAVTALALAALGWGIVRRPLLRENALWIGWLAAWWLLFSWFDNKQPRFVAFAVPGLVMLAVGGAAWITSASRRLRAAACGVLAVVLVCQSATASRQRYVGYSGMEPIVQRLFVENGKGNLAYFDGFRQMFVPFVRLHDPERSVYVLQGDDIVRASADLAAACRDYRVRYVILDRVPHGETSDPDIETQLSSQPCFRRVRVETFGKPSYRIQVLIYEYTGPVADTMKVIPLQSDTLKIYYR